MFEELVDGCCRSLSGTIEARPFGPETRVWTVGSRMFAIHVCDGDGVSVACQSALHAQVLVQSGKAISAPYLRDHGWVLMRFQCNSPEALCRRIHDSYDRVRAGLRADVEVTLPPSVRMLPN